MKPIILIFFKFSRRNLFINVFWQFDEIRIPLFFESINLHFEIGKDKAQSDKAQSEKAQIYNLKRFAALAAIWIKSLKKKFIKLVIIFKYFGLRFKKYQQTHHGLIKLRFELIDALTENKLAIAKIIDITGIAFNGCDGRRQRRKKRKNNDKQSSK